MLFCKLFKKSNPLHKNFKYLLTFSITCGTIFYADEKVFFFVRIFLVTHSKKVLQKRTQNLRRCIPWEQKSHWLVVIVSREITILWKTRKMILIELKWKNTVVSAGSILCIKKQNNFNFLPSEVTYCGRSSEKIGKQNCQIF